jgi:hypothetical protein
MKNLFVARRNALAILKQTLKRATIKIEYKDTI